MKNTKSLVLTLGMTALMAANAMANLSIGAASQHGVDAATNTGAAASAVSPKGTAKDNAAVNASASASRSNVSGTTDLSNSGSLGIVRERDAMPEGSSAIAAGQVVNINRNNHTIKVRDTNTGSVSVQSFKDNTLFANLKEGDSVKIFSDSGSK